MTTTGDPMPRWNIAPPPAPRYIIRLPADTNSEVIAEVEARWLESGSSGVLAISDDISVINLETGEEYGPRLLDGPAQDRDRRAGLSRVDRGLRGRVRHGHHPRAVRMKPGRLELSPWARAGIGAERAALAARVPAGHKLDIVVSQPGPRGVWTVRLQLTPPRAGLVAMGVAGTWREAVDAALRVAS